MNERFKQLLGRVAASLVGYSRDNPWTVIGLSLALTIASALQAANYLAIDTDPDLMTSPDLGFRKTNAALFGQFPDLQDNLVVLVEANDGEDARDAAEELATLLRAAPERFPEVFLPGDDPFYEDSGLFYLDRERLADTAARIDRSGPLLATLAERPEIPVLLGALSHIIASEEGIASLEEDGGLILDRVSEAVEAYNGNERAPIDWDDLLFEDLEGDFSDFQVLFVHASGDVAKLELGLEAIDEVRKRISKLEPRPGLRARVTGDAAVHTEEMSFFLEEAAIALSASLILVTVLLLYGFRSLRLMIGTILTLLVGLVWTAAFAATAIGHLNVITSAFAVLYVGLGVDFGIHFAMGFIEQRGTGASKRVALSRTGSEVGSSLVFCALTTAIGFFAFIPTSYTAVAELGIISGVGIFISLLATLTWFPAWISVSIGEPNSPGRLGRQRFDLSLPTFPLRHPKIVCMFALALAAASTFALFHLRFDMNPLKVRDPRVESVQAMKDLLAEEEISSWTIELLAADLEEARSLRTRLLELPEVRDVLTVEQFLPEEQEWRLEVFADMREALSAPVELSEDETGGEDPAKALEYTILGYGVALDIDSELTKKGEEIQELTEKTVRLRGALERLMDERLADGGTPDTSTLEEDLFGSLPDLLEGVRDSLPMEVVTLESLPANLARRYLSPDGHARVEIFAADNLDDVGALEHFTDAVQSVEPNAGGPVTATVELGRAIVTALEQAMTMAVIVIAALMLILWRSIKYAAITMAPLALGSAATAAFTVAMDVPFNFANVIVLPLLLGIGVDSGIHLVHRHRFGEADSSDLLHTGTARAVLFSALTTLASFSTLAFSNHLGIASLAQLLTIGVTLMLLSNVIVLPAILAWVDPKEPEGAGDRRRAS